MIVTLRPFSWLLTAVLLLVLHGSTTFAQDETTPPAEENPPAEEQVDPFEVPQGTARELFLFINKIKRETPAERTREAVIAHLKKQVGAVMEAADAILAQDISDEDAVRAIEEKFVGLSVLARFDADAQQTLISLAESLQNDPRPTVVHAADFQLLQQGIVKALSGRDDPASLGDLFQTFIEKHGLDKQIVSLVAELGQMLDRRQPDVARQLLTQLLPVIQKSEDPEILARAERLEAAVRRLSLPGNFMELFGKTDDGARFDWESYRGRYVLIDFWATWCGPCRAEIPNVKRNLDKYGERGFAVVGVNIDRNRADYDAFMEEAQLPWPNIMPNDDGSSPLADYYDVTGIPTVILVNPKGHVISLNARGPELGRLLETHLGGAAETSGAE